ncbi:hypothetical protein A2929_02940 [Candidatus Kaiserbacteria bacterium RIFCSPLOWO2_01_FULL_45_25]|uniref:Uncharacterized protein n=1 Tax=Candidatus Kaiserbacteria bacterium RIFCSPLOWO2_12_FULL_45_26 TaxID=1798525 RepID=A0A1F6FFK4_9BACT|nr:MAG: hypothetical protein A2Z56_04880 [Candidatus Kaiserbacteria bacterium RIFCSPHIGHO2_12_45_16]OGG69500.1 MAG: hypothetical protein A2929_02940 [Candidatus Kaiserbacteria bacterium RIFCSPLOWO2_01_FULL_45_25]OGG84640.1 MAG: hypothetical protein A3G90_00960 [Candidatus Kaiserbacteria bacterium RIFCSPLOWO2_12_FULL_45_26]
METKYAVFFGPHFPPAVRVGSAADACLVAQVGCTMEVLLAFTVPHRPQPYPERVLFLKKKEGRDELEGYAKTLNSKKVSAKNKEALLKELKEKRLVQLNVTEVLARAKRTAWKPVASRADFGNLLAGEREGSFSRRGAVDGLW